MRVGNFTAAKRHKKLLKRKFVRRVKMAMFVTQGAYHGAMMYRMWRERECGISA